MKTRCKFVCYEINESVGTRWENGTTVQIPMYGAKFRPVSGNSEENKQFFANTPTGTFEVYCTMKRFEPGKEYYIDIEEAN